MMKCKVFLENKDWNMKMTPRALRVKAKVNKLGTLRIEERSYYVC